MLQAWTDVLENMPDAVFIVAGTGKAGRILYLNLQAIRMFGFERSEIVNQSIELLVPHNVRERHIQHRLGYVGFPGDEIVAEIAALLKERGRLLEFWQLADVMLSLRVLRRPIPAWPASPCRPSVRPW